MGRDGTNQADVGESDQKEDVREGKGPKSGHGSRVKLVQFLAPAQSPRSLKCYHDGDGDDDDDD